LKNSDPSGEWLIEALVFTAFLYLKGAHDNKVHNNGKWDFNPFNWSDIPSFSINTKTNLEADGGMNTDIGIGVTPTNSNTSINIDIGTNITWSNTDKDNNKDQVLDSPELIKEAVIDPSGTNRIQNIPIPPDGDKRNGSYMSYSAELTVGGGITYEIGFVTDSNDEKAFFFTFAGNTGLGAGYGFNIGRIEPTGNHSFVLDDWAGEGGSYDLSLETPFGSWGLGRAGNFEDDKSFFNERNYSFPDFNLGKGERGYTIIPISHGVAPSPKFKVGGKISRSKTYIYKLKPWK